MLGYLNLAVGTGWPGVQYSHPSPRNMLTTRPAGGRSAGPSAGRGQGRRPADDESESESEGESEDESESEESDLEEPAVRVAAITHRADVRSRTAAELAIEHAVKQARQVWHGEREEAEERVRQVTEVRSANAAEVAIEQGVQNAKHAWEVERAQLIKQHEVRALLPTQRSSTAALSSHASPPHPAPTHNLFTND